MCVTEARNEVNGREWLFPYSQSLDQALVSLKIALFEIVEMPSPLPNELKKATTGMVVLNVNLEVLGQVFDTLTQ
jgi:hypothetical protein